MSKRANETQIAKEAMFNANKDLEEITRQNTLLTNECNKLKTRVTELESVSKANNVEISTRESGEGGEKREQTSDADNQPTRKPKKYDVFFLHDSLGKTINPTISKREGLNKEVRDIENPHGPEIDQISQRGPTTVCSARWN